jgi:hypothetical protein
LLVGIAIDHEWGARFGVGVSRTTWLAILTPAIWLRLILPMCAIRRALLRRSAGGWSFADAFDRAWKPVHARAESASAEERRSLAESVRLDMSGVTKRHFA